MTRRDKRQSQQRGAAFKHHTAAAYKPLQQPTKFRRDEVAPTYPSKGVDK